MEERNLLSVAYSWRIFSSIDQDDSRGNEDHVSIIKKYRSKIKIELSKICDVILNLLESNEFKTLVVDPGYWVFDICCYLGFITELELLWNQVECGCASSHFGSLLVF